MIDNNLISNDILHFYPVKIFKNINKNYLYNTKTASIFEVDEPTIELIQTSGLTYDEAYDKFKHVWSKKEFDNILSLLKEKCLLKDSQIESSFNKNLNKSKTQNICSIALFVIQECNLRCTYCYGHGGEYNNKGILKLETAKQAVDFLFEKSGEKKDISIAFFGGEPLLNFPLICEIVDYCKYRNKEFNKNITYATTTNGTLLTDKITEFLISNKFSITISIDGNKESHNINRFFENGAGSYDKVIDKTRNLIKGIPVSARATITKTNLNLVQNFHDLYEKGFKRVNMAPCSEMLDDNDYTLMADNYSEMIEEFDKLLKNKQFDKAKAMGGVIQKLSKIDGGGIRNRFCGSITKGLAVDVNGNIYPCHRFVGTTDFKIGDVFNGFDEDKYSKIINDTYASEHEDCSNCWAVNLCGGGCNSENFVTTGSIKSPNPNFCKYNKKAFESAIQYYVSMPAEERELIFNKN